MGLQEFRRYMKRECNAVDLTSRFTLFSYPWELYDNQTDTSVEFKNLNDALSYKIDDKTIQDYIEDFKPLATIDGGRGASGSVGEYKFGHANRGNSKDNTHDIHPAYMNTANKTRSVDGAIRAFGDRYRNADHEYGASVDDLGYTHKLVDGNKTNVGIWAKGKGHMVLHNHPSGGNFSDSDLISTSRDKKARGIVALGKKGDFIFTKGAHFNATAFEKAVKRARMKGKSYDDAVGNWLKANQKKYGYSYEFRKLKKGK